MAPSPHFIFVYGTLQRGDCRHGYLANQQFMGLARTLPQYRLFDLGSYPGLVPVSVGGRSISGEVWRVTDKCLRVLDIVEGVAEGLYARRPVAVVDSTEVVETYLYQGSVEGCPDCGDSW